MKKSNFTYTIDGRVLFIEDSNMGGMSVTNDVENVIEEMNTLLSAMGTSVKDFDVIYRDSDGMIDGIKTKDGKFHDFYFIGDRNYNAAKLKIKA